MRLLRTLLGVCSVVLLSGSGSLRAAPPQSGQAAPSQQIAASKDSGAATAQRAVIDKYCVTCHNARTKAGGLALDSVPLDSPAAHADVWERVSRKLRGGMMPPPSAPRPEGATIDSLVTWLEHTIDRDALAHPNPGRAPLHRLNRTEYANAVRDLLDLEVDVSALLPADDESDGFDNIADVLKVSPSLLEQYLAASSKVSSLATGDPATKSVSSVYRVPPDLSQEDQIDGLPLGTRGGLLIKHNFPLDGEYDFSVKLLRNIVGYLTGLEFAHQLEISIDGVQVFVSQVGGDEDNRLSDENMSRTADLIDERLKIRVPVAAGPRAVGVTFLRRNAAESDEPLQPHIRDHDLQNMNGVPLVDFVDIRGPVNATGPGDTPSRRRIFSCRPSAARDETRCARQILGTLARRAYRRPVTGDEIATLLRFYQDGRAGGDFDAGIRQGLRFILASPKFLFRAEPDPAGAAPGTVYRLGGIELASRLSFFLWSSLPDDQLLDLAARGKLSDPAVLEQQVRRMLSDPRSHALVSNFAGQWLFLRNLQSALPDGQEFPNFDDGLRQAFRRETELFFESIMREDRSVLDLLTADYTFVNERLARHYGIDRVYGTRFRRVKLPDDRRRGLLGQGSVLTVTSYPNRTSPVLRGKWILENILGTPPPPPPPNVPALSDSGEEARAQTVRERTEAHRKNAACASCHRIMDPLGFSLENFDAVGAWRTKESGGAVDTSGELADGTSVNGPVSLRTALVNRSGLFVRTLARKMLTYALGRGVTDADMPIVRRIADSTARADYRFSGLVLEIVRSAPFQMKKVNEGPAAPSGTTASLH